MLSQLVAQLMDILACSRTIGIQEIASCNQLHMKQNSQVQAVITKNNIVGHDLVVCQILINFAGRWR